MAPQVLGFEIDRSKSRRCALFFCIVPGLLYTWFEVEPGGTVLDVGAYMGWFTVPAAKRAGKQGFIVAVEPEPENLAFLRVNVSKLGNVQIVEKCAWKGRQRMKLYIGPTYLMHSLVLPYKGDYIWVQSDTLDNIISGLGIDKVDFIKIDVEGAELEVLEGAERVLKNAKKVAAAAYHVRKGKQTWPEVRRILEQKGFKERIPPVSDRWLEPKQWTLADFVCKSDDSCRRSLTGGT